jgi:membrane protein DedA with SNARE-associated domain
MDAVLGRLGELGPWSYVVVGAFAFLEASAFVGLVAPGETAVLFGGFLAGQGYVSPVGVAASAALGGVLGDTVGYELGYRAGPRLLARWRLRRAAVDRARRAFQRHGGKAVFFGRFVGFLRAFAPFVAGLSGMPYRRFVVYNASGAVLWAVACTALGYLAGANWRRIGHWVSWTGAAVVLALAVVVALRWRRLRRALA